MVSGTDCVVKFVYAPCNTVIDPLTPSDPVICAEPVYGNAVPPPPNPDAAAEADMNVGETYDAVCANELL